MDFSIIELIIISISILIIIITSISDIKQSVVKNKTIIVFAITLLPFIIYYNFFVYPEMLTKYLLNVSILTFISVLLYHQRIWGGGDSKLTILLSFCIPVRLYFNNNSLFPLLEWPVYIFSIGYLYILYESIYLRITDKKKERIITLNDVFIFIKSYVFMSVYMTIISELFHYIASYYYENNILLFWFISSFISIIIYNYTLFRNTLVFIIAVVINICLLLQKSFIIISITPYFIILVLYLLKKFMSLYNYKNINYTELKEGMILSAKSTLQFYNSKDHNLPLNISENLDAKLSSNNIFAVKKWYLKHPESDDITIVKKVPFAVFVGLGYIYYICLGVLK